MSNKKILLICLGIFSAGIIITILIFSTEPEATREGASIETAMLVDVIAAEKGTFKPVITATGTIQPIEDVILSPLVPGQVIRRDPAFTPGGFVKKGQVLLQIDPADYRNTLRLRKSDLLQSQSALETEMGRQQIAEQDLQLIADDSIFGNRPLSEEEKQLVLRKPQLSAVEATIDASEAAMEQARLNLSRTTIRAPFDAHILSQNVTKGSQVSPGDALGRIVGIDYYWVIATVPVSKLQWLEFPSQKAPKGSPVRIENSTAWSDDTFRQGYLDKQIGALEGQTRLARLLIKVADPLNKKQHDKKKPTLIIGSFVEVDIQAATVTNVVRLNRDYVRTNNTVWIMNNKKLEIRNVDVLMTDGEYAYISDGIEDGEKVVITDLSTVSEGVGLRTQNENSKIKEE